MSVLLTIIESFREPDKPRDEQSQLKNISAKKFTTYLTTMHSKGQFPAQEIVFKMMMTKLWVGSDRSNFQVLPTNPSVSFYISLRYFLKKIGIH